jgi:hypothetical protein
MLSSEMPSAGSGEIVDVVVSEVQLKTRHPYWALMVFNGQSGGISGVEQFFVL